MSDQDMENGSGAIPGLLLQEPGPEDTQSQCGSPDSSQPPGPATPGGHARSKKSHAKAVRAKGKVVVAEKVMQAFNTWAFKREQPDDPLLMLQTISRSIARSEPVRFVLYWGKGPRAAIGAPDVECLEYIASLARRVGEAYPAGAAITLIFTDTHAALNGHEQSAIRDYFSGIEGCARAFGFEHCWMSHLTRAAEGVLADDPIDDAAPDDDVLKQLSTAAAKWYFGKETPHRAALIYYRLNMIEKRVVESAFPHSIFITFNGGRLRCLFPKRLPIFYMYSLRRGVSVKPWFFTADSTH